MSDIDETKNEKVETQEVPLDDLLVYIDQLIKAFESHPDETTHGMVFQLLDALDGLHRQAFHRLSAFLEDKSGENLLEEAAKADRLIDTVLQLYDVFDDSKALKQVETALAQVQPYIESHGGTLKLVKVSNGTVQLQMGGACRGCPGSQFTLQRGVERAIKEHYTDFSELVVIEPIAPEGAKTHGGTIPLGDVYSPPSLLQAPQFHPTITPDDLPKGSLKQVDVEGTQVLLAHLENGIYAVGAYCPDSALPLTTGELDGLKITCPWHGEQFDLSTGECLDSAKRRTLPRLPVYPMALKDGKIHVAVNVPARPMRMVTADE